MTRQDIPLLALLATLVLGLCLASLLIGPARLPPGASLAALWSDDGLYGTIMREIRLPRALLGGLVGAALGASGAALQGFLRNPLAEPGLIGTSAAAALGAVLAMQGGLAAAWALGLPLAALTGAGIAMLLVLVLAGPHGTALGLILAGIAISALAGAGSSLVLSLSPNPFAANEIVFWMMGSLADRSLLHLAIAAPPILVGLALLWRLGRAIEALSLGEDAAMSLGVHLRRVRLVLTLGIALAVGGATAVAGAIGFVGLVVPHLLRRATQGSPARLLPAATLGGAAMVLAADIAVRLIAPDRDLKLGVLTALVGAPFFLHLILKTRREGL
ncbi:MULTISPECIES: FecCD family ABC transporter permease [unclassified Paracoccus (in: a-proteobacteria)]|uniref:FecCD family ABC transporter permease n=1 Tax=unclassified Paracoccus (in: a-proteobacteria) TaxID=2688777 RepID=UPI0021E117F9|nr:MULTISPECIES: iron ABC transporter permease [unclassified Paracoccus (in: a-proteobacteria)]UXU76494.1 iron ABC transporter permease [Paracoccus sp. SMMA_5]UXU82439.1 iron ABC transporter permease [Paracoccus sp. SMMA_5_TC]